MNNDTHDKITVEADMSSEEIIGARSEHTDADAMRRLARRENMNHAPEWDPSVFKYEIIPDVYEHTWNPSLTRKAGGTDVLASGKPGTGKSSLGLTMSMRVMEINDETVIWRGSPSRSEWLPFAPWATLHLPERCKVDARIEPKDPTKSEQSVEIEDIVREVRRYANPIDLNKQQIQTGKFNVVYPDPRKFDCQAIYEDSNKKYEGIEFSEDGPLNHWWFAWILARIEEGPYDWWTWVADEIGDLAPQSAESDTYGTYDKINLLQDCWVDARKKGLTIYAFGHAERDIHDLLRHKIRWRIQMNGTANPTSGSELVGFNSVRMNSDITSQMPVGEGLIYTESAFDKIYWYDFPDPPEITGSLVVDVTPERPKSARSDVGESSRGVADD